MANITTREAARRLGVSPVRVRALIADGRLPSLKEGRDHMIREEDLERVRHRTPGRPKPFDPSAILDDDIDDAADKADDARRLLAEIAAGARRGDEWSRERLLAAADRVRAAMWFDPDRTADHALQLAGAYRNLALEVDGAEVFHAICAALDVDGAALIYPDARA